MTKPTQFFDPDGKQVTLTVGQTFVQVLPSAATRCTIKDGSDHAAGHAGAVGHAELTPARAPSERVANRYGARLIPTSA